MTDSDKVYAVLTGDLVKSSRLSSAQSKAAMEWLKQRVKDFERIWPEAVIGNVDTFRHDSWQLCLSRPELGVRAALFLRTALRMKSDAETKLDTRISIGLGTAEHIEKRRISNSRGLAFMRSGKGLDAMAEHGLVFVPQDESSKTGQWVAKGIIPLLDCIVHDWTATESRAIYGAFMNWTQEQSAENWPVDNKARGKPSRQAVGKSLTRAHWAAINDILIWVEKELSQPLKVAYGNSNL